VLHSAGLAHRDIKPDNIMAVFDDYQRLRFKLIDYGFVKKVNQEFEILANVGTPQFKAAELFGDDTFDCVAPVGNSLKTDIWSLGVSLLFILVKGLFPSLETEPEIFKAVSHGHIDFC
jgi:serine/threonine protein kinase